MSKAQLSSMELIAGVFVFILVFVFLFLTFNSYNTKLSNDLENNDRQRAILQVTDSLIKILGVPENWESNENIRKIGLVNNDRILNQSKIVALEDLGYDELKSFMGIDKYNFNLTIKFANDEIISSVGIPITGKKISTIRRFAVYNNKDAIIDFALF